LIYFYFFCLIPSLCHFTSFTPVSCFILYAFLSSFTKFFHSMLFLFSLVLFPFCFSVFLFPSSIHSHYTPFLPYL
jgi:hypothetical protein